MLLMNFFLMVGFIQGTNNFLKPLTEEEEKKYINEMDNGSIEAKNILIEHNLRLVAHIAKKFYDTNYEKDDLISVGTIGLIKGVNSFDSSKNAKLSTYCSRCIENEIYMLFRRNKKRQTDISLSETIGIDKDGNEVRIEDKISDDNTNTELEVETKDNINKMNELLDKTLKKKELSILKMRYGINCMPKTQKEIGKILNMSRSYVSRVEKRALSKMLEAMEKR